MKTALALLLVTLTLAGIAAVPSGGAQAATIACGFGLHVWHADYSCHVNGAGTGGNTSWCPDPLLCRDRPLLSCWIDNSPPYYCYLL